MLGFGFFLYMNQVIDVGCFKGDVSEQFILGPRLFEFASNC